MPAVVVKEAWRRGALCPCAAAFLSLWCEEGLLSSGNADGCSGLAGAVLVPVSGAVDKTLQWRTRRCASTRWDGDTV